MVARQPEPYISVNGGMDPGLKNPLGGALYFPGGSGYALSHPRLTGMVDHRQVCVIRVRTNAQPGRDRSLQPGSEQHAHTGMQRNRKIEAVPLFLLVAGIEVCRLVHSNVLAIGCDAVTS